MAPLIAAVILGMALLSIAIISSDDRVHDDYYEQGRLINHRFEAEKHAVRIGVAGRIEFDLGAMTVQVHFERPVQGEVLQLILSHPAEATGDRGIKLKPVEPSVYRAALPAGNYNGRRYLILSRLGEADKAIWRVSTEIDFSLTQSALFGSRTLGRL